MLAPPAAPPAEPELVEALAGRGWKAERHLQATRLVIDDFGNAVAVERRCPGCRRWIALRAKGYCSPCGWFKNRKWARDNSERRNRTAAALRRKLIAGDPEFVERERSRHRVARAARRERDPERERALGQARNARYLKKLRQDPERAQRRLENLRIDNGLRRMARGLPVGNGYRRVDGTPDARRYVAATPLAAVVAEECERTDVGLLAELLGVSTRLLYAWRTGERRAAWWDTADKVLVGLGLNWWEVYDPTYAKPGAFSGVRSRDVAGWLEAAMGAAEAWGDE